MGFLSFCYTLEMSDQKVHSRVIKNREGGMEGGREERREGGNKTICS